MANTEDSAFWEVAEPFLANGAEQSTMMGHPCLRMGGEFFTSLDPSSGEMIVKLSAARVDELIERGEANSFAPNGRRFKEWASVPVAREEAWASLMDEALAFVTGS